jgi:hypothetical protein
MINSGREWDWMDNIKKPNMSEQTLMSTNWHIQYLKSEELWYLTQHDMEDGVIFEGFYNTVSHLLEDLNKYLNNTNEN